MTIGIVNPMCGSVHEFLLDILRVADECKAIAVHVVIHDDTTCKSFQFGCEDPECYLDSARAVIEHYYLQEYEQ